MTEQMEFTDKPTVKVLTGQEIVVFDIVKNHQPIITALLIRNGIDNYVGCPDKIARNLRTKGLVDSRPVKGKGYVEWFINDRG